jgi:hypothetical protein
MEGNNISYHAVIYALNEAQSILVLLITVCWKWNVLLWGIENNELLVCYIIDRYIEFFSFVRSSHIEIL